MGNWFASKWAGGKFYDDWFGKVSAPVPVTPVTVFGGGGGVEYWRLTEERKRRERERRFAEEIACKYLVTERIRKQDPQYKQQRLKEERSERNLKNQLRVLRKRLKELEKDLKEERSERFADLEMLKQLEGDIRRYKRALKRMRRSMRRRSRGDSLIKINLVEFVGQEPEKKKVKPEPEPATKPRRRRRTPLPSGFITSRAVMSAVPWAAGSLLAAVGTYYLVPDGKRMLKFAGYSASGLLGAFSIYRFFSVKAYFDLRNSLDQ